MASVTGHHLSRVVLLRWLAVGSVAAAVVLLSGCVPTTETFWSPDGSAVAYQSDGQLYLYDVVTKESREVNTGDMSVGPLAWSPDASRIAAYGTKEGAPEQGLLCLVDMPSAHVAVLAEHVWEVTGEALGGLQSDLGTSDPGAVAAFVVGFYGPMAWSPDSRRIAYLSALGAHFSVVVVDVTCGAGKTVVESGNCIPLVAWSPDGTRLAYVTVPPESSPATAKAALFTYDFAAEAHTKITDLPGDGIAGCTRLQWSPDSTQIGLIVPDPPNGTAIGCLVDAKPGAEVRKVVRGISETAAWSPNLTGVAFVEEREDAAVVLYRGVQPPVRRVLGSIPQGSDLMFSPLSIPQFSPDGRSVSFLNYMGDTLEVGVLTVR